VYASNEETDDQDRSGAGGIIVAGTYGLELYSGVYSKGSVGALGLGWLNQRDFRFGIHGV